jgi:P27 family predicted phage terminase small subunit
MRAKAGVMRGTKPHMQHDDGALMKVPKAPAWFTKAAKGEWKRIMPLLIERKILTEADMGGVENYCVAMGQVRDMQAMIAVEKAVIMTARGQRAHPAVRIQADAMNRARLLAAELGLTPVSRSRPAIRDDDDTDSLLD